MGIKRKDYIEKMIQRGLENGVTVEQMMKNPELTAKAYLESELKSINGMSDKIFNQLKTL